MSTGAFSIDQLMELAGLSVSQAGTVLLLYDLLGWKMTIWLTEPVQSTGFSLLAVAAESWSHAVPGITVRLRRRLGQKSAGSRADLVIRW